MRQQEFPPRTFRKRWWQSSLRHEFHEFTPIVARQLTELPYQICDNSCNSCHAIVLVQFVSLLRSQNSNQVAQLIFDIAWQHHRVSDFFAQQLPIALTQSMERLLHGVLGHGQFTCNLCLRRAI